MHLEGVRKMLCGIYLRVAKWVDFTQSSTNELYSRCLPPDIVHSVSTAMSHVHGGETCGIKKQTFSSQLNFRTKNAGISIYYLLLRAFIRFDRGLIYSIMWVIFSILSGFCAEYTMLSSRI